MMMTEADERDSFCNIHPAADTHRRGRFFCFLARRDGAWMGSKKRRVRNRSQRKREEGAPVHRVDWMNSETGRGWRGGTREKRQTGRGGARSRRHWRADGSVGETNPRVGRSIRAGRRQKTRLSLRHTTPPSLPARHRCLFLKKISEKKREIILIICSEKNKVFTKRETSLFCDFGQLLRIFFYCKFVCDDDDDKVFTVSKKKEYFIFSFELWSSEISILKWKEIASIWQKCI